MASGYVRLYRADENKEGYINLTSYEPTPDQIKLLNLGLNCHVLKKPRRHQKRVEIEVLLENIYALEHDGKVSISPNLSVELLAEAGKSRDPYKSRLIDTSLKKATRKLPENEDNVIGRANKSAMFVLLPKFEYLQKMDMILEDASKFERISRDPTIKLISKCNGIIDAVNAKAGGIHLSRISGDHGPGYAYGNVKTQKSNHPLRPIISQIPTPTYNLAKILNSLLSPYTPSIWLLKSPKEFIDLLHSKEPTGLIASLDTKSLFTNGPIDETIDFILDDVYRSHHQHLDIPENRLCLLLEACTKESPFRGPDGNMYRQVDGVAMESPFGVLFANFYMGLVERRVLSVRHLRPFTCGGYVDDIFVEVRDRKHPQDLHKAFISSSCLNFTLELHDDGSLPFLDVFIKPVDRKFVTSVHVKETNKGRFLNVEGEYPTSYKRSVIRSYVNRAFTHCSTWPLLHQELQRLQQVLVNNGFSNKDVQSIIMQKMDTYMRCHNPRPEKHPLIPLHYRSIMSTAYRTDERLLREIVERGTRPIDPENKLELHTHSTLLSREILVDNSRILDSANDSHRSEILEALYIKEKAPTMNLQNGITPLALVTLHGHTVTTTYNSKRRTDRIPPSQPPDIRPTLQDNIRRT
ncbi:uncharacterized protein LOC143033200 [Oratosquilla oratoria]|uniref:uncharacterized protein LOC143033200 n=1 Tax=Oratosquilla oratoria TaxID=337810 RepID=UPI003F770E53